MEHDDPSRGLLRLPARSLGALALMGSAGSGLDTLPELPSEDVVRLRQAGVLDTGGLCPAVLPVADAIARTVVHLRLTRATASATAVTYGWISPAAAALAQLVGDGFVEVRAILPHAVPHELAKLVDVGPRPVFRDAIALSKAGIVFRVGRRTAGLPDDADLSEAAKATLLLIEHGLQARWTLTSGWRSAGVPVARAVEVLDAATAGCWLLDTTDRTTVLHPLSGASIWRLLVAALPTDHELRPPKVRISPTLFPAR